MCPCGEGNGRSPSQFCLCRWRTAAPLLPVSSRCRLAAAPATAVSGQPFTSTIQVVIVGQSQNIESSGAEVGNGRWFRPEEGQGEEENGRWGKKRFMMMLHRV